MPDLEAMTLVFTIRKDVPDRDEALDLIEIIQAALEGIPDLDKKALVTNHFNLEEP